MAGRVLRYTARTHGLGYRALNRRLVNVMPPPFATRPIDVDPRRRKYVLPTPVAIGIRHFSLKCARQRRSHNARSQITLELLPHTLHLNLERRRREPGKGNAPILITLPNAYHDLVAIKIDILDAKLGTLGQAQAAPVHEARA